ncbi:MAG TPA: DUF6789 family protein [Ignavibacteriaceae bacterium]|nr:DUF6789 family protein [Ignavibacteriaceae bacterium]
MKNQINLNSAIVSGIAATAAMTLFMFMAPLMGLKMNIPAMLASTMGLPIVFGWIAHFMVGIILALIYSLIYLRITKRKGSLKSGAVFSLFPWLMAQIVIIPMMSVMNGMSFMTGLFSGSLLLAMASLAGHLIYGIVLGMLYNSGEEKS